MFNSMFNTIFCKYVNTNIYKKSLVHIKSNLKTEKIKNFGAQFF